MRFRQLVPALFYPWTAAVHGVAPGIRVLMYHRVDRISSYDQLNVTPERFESQMAHLAQHHRVIGLRQAVDALQSRTLPGNAVVITFDDGYKDNLVHAYPVLKRYGLPATIFVTTHFCDGRVFHPRYAGAADLHLTWDDVRRLAQDPLITIGSHTMTHPHLPTLTDAEAHREIAESRNIIQSQLNAPVDFFCYPSGNFGLREMQLVKAAGYAAAVSVAPGRNRDFATPFSLRRTEITDRDGAWEFRAKLSGAFDPLHRWLHAKRLRAFDHLKTQGEGK
jgi:peptidoglycan/xylan/chitin deacetylase (PgdA/CDA1 family)